MLIASCGILLEPPTLPASEEPSVSMKPSVIQKLFLGNRGSFRHIRHMLLNLLFISNQCRIKCNLSKSSTLGTTYHHPTAPHPTPPARRPPPPPTAHRPPPSRGGAMAGRPPSASRPVSQRAAPLVGPCSRGAKPESSAAELSRGAVLRSCAARLNNGAVSGSCTAWLSCSCIKTSWRRPWDQSSRGTAGRRSGRASP